MKDRIRRREPYETLKRIHEKLSKIEVKRKIFVKFCHNLFFDHHLRFNIFFFYNTTEKPAFEVGADLVEKDL